jgi:predicted lipase
LSEKTSPCFGLVYYSSEKDALIIVFRCTKTQKEWGCNYKFKQTKFENTNAHVHFGFHSIFMQVKHQVQAIIKENPSCRILFYGYSLGAAVASLTALSIQQEHIDTKVFCFCFGKPRVGDPEYCEIVNETFANRFYRLENQEDFAPDLPPTVCANFWDPKKPFIYKHEGNLAQFSIHSNTLGGSHSMQTSLQYIKSRLQE